MAEVTSGLSEGFYLLRVLRTKNRSIPEAFVYPQGFGREPGSNPVPYKDENHAREIRDRLIAESPQIYSRSETHERVIFLMSEHGAMEVLELFAKDKRRGC